MGDNMMFSSPFFDRYDSDPHYYQPSTSYPSRRRRYLQQLRAAEEAERQRQQERARQEEYLRHKMEEEEAYRQAYYEAATRRCQMEEARQIQEYLFGNNSPYSDDDDYDESSEEEEIVMEPVYRVIQGPHGQLYKVKIGERPTSRSQPKPPRRRRNTSITEPKQVAPQIEDNSGGSYQLVRGPDGRIYRLQLEGRERADKREMKQQQKEEGPAAVPSWFPRVNDDEVETDDEKEATAAAVPSMRIPIRTLSISSGDGVSLRRRSSSSGKKKKKKQKVTVVVENASDSESEEDEYKSAWRNRRPSPGEWMEPVNIIRA